MAITVGLKRATIKTLDENGKVTTKSFTIEGKQNEGGMVEASISGISAEASKVFASDVPYFVSQKGVGDLQCEFSILDFPFGAQAELLGWTTDTTSGVMQIGDKTQPPYAATLLESSNAAGVPVAIGLYKGRFSQEEMKLATLTEDAFEPEAETIKMNCIANDEGNSIGIAVGAEQVAALKAITFPEIEVA
ncbi:major tail protein [Listeria fleischmannii]|uniref:Major tail protein n=1 Tax=Listeria fleischmannii FSL S10-1203 TaxID=1265822 RepID=W7DNN1_9LIST|nr:major tail protein [Listeria fleischmannii]EUJ59555.1 major tail protein [Listeria fleischmannii FSL S10-1203]